MEGRSRCSYCVGGEAWRKFFEDKALRGHLNQGQIRQRPRDTLASGEWTGTLGEKLWLPRFILSEKIWADRSVRLIFGGPPRNIAHQAE